MSEIAISLKNVSKCFKRYGRPIDRLKELLLPGKSRAEFFWALQDINLTLPRGETLGIVGKNGSGKSTLLQIIAGTLTPTTGEVQVNGRVSALLELGSGFNPEFTGRQNVFFNGRLLGLSQNEIEDKFDNIARFADIGDFIEQPVKTYSSGMFVRLAFAVAINVEPDILMVDEALSVGDIKFQLKCFTKFREFQQKGTTIIFVTHDSNLIKRYCNRAILLNLGQNLLDGKPNKVINYYTKILFSEQELEDTKVKASLDNTLFDTSLSTNDTLEYRYGDHRGKIEAISLENSRGEATNYFCTCEKSLFKIIVTAEETIEKPIFAMTLKDAKGEDIYITNTYFQGLEVPDIMPGHKVIVSFEQKIRVCPGDYFISFGFVSLKNGNITPINRRYDAIQIKVFTSKSDQSSGIVNLQSKISFDLGATV